MIGRSLYKKFLNYPTKGDQNILRERAGDNLR